MHGFCGSCGRDARSSFLAIIEWSLGQTSSAGALQTDTNLIGGAIRVGFVKKSYTTVQPEERPGRSLRNVMREDKSYLRWLSDSQRNLSEAPISDQFTAVLNDLSQ